MIARSLSRVTHPTLPSSAAIRSGRGAGERRRKIAARTRYAMLARLVVSVVSVTALVMVYLLLMAKATQLNYDLVAATHERTQLQARTAHLQDVLSTLESRERLLHYARELGMTEPQSFTVVDIPTEHVAQRPSGALALLWSVRDWLK